MWNKEISRPPPEGSWYNSLPAYFTSGNHKGSFRMKENDARWKLGTIKRMEHWGYGKYVRKYIRLSSLIYVFLWKIIFKIKITMYYRVYKMYRNKIW